MTPAEILQRAEDEGLVLTGRTDEGHAKIRVELPDDLEEVPGWLIEEKATWDPEAVRQAIMTSASKDAAVLDAAEVVRRCRREGIRLTVGETEDGPTVAVTLPVGREMPAWLRDWALFNTAEGLLPLIGGDAPDGGQHP